MNTERKTKLQKWIVTVIVFAINFLLWVIPGNVTYLITQQRDVLLNRYSVERVTLLIFLIPVSAVILYLNWSNRQNERKRQFQVASAAISVLLCLFAADVFLRLIDRQHYVVDADSLHRQPNTIDKGVRQDVPESAFSYPVNRPGFPDINYTLTVDKRGFRNKIDLPRYDVIVLGDSFAEGSGVSDEQAWPVLLSQKAGISVYNLAVSGGNPKTYLQALQQYGLQLSPKTVICMLYEGNDFRASNFRTKSALTIYFKSSPVRRVLKQSLIRWLGSSAPQKPSVQSPAAPMNTASLIMLASKQKPVTFAEEAESDENTRAISWLPVALPDGNNPKYYAFKIKKLLAHFEDAAGFSKSTGYLKTLEALTEINNLCRKAGSRLIIVYAPDAPHVLMPLIKDKVPADSLRAFISVKQKDVPPSDKLIAKLIESVEVQENDIRQFCGSNSIEFISLTEPMRQAIAQGKQAYFTYDQHWTPIGHKVTADVLCKSLSTQRAQAKQQ